MDLKNEELEHKLNTKRKFICECLPARLILYLLCLTGIAVSFVMRIAMPLTILAMVKNQLAVLNQTNNFEKKCYFETNSSAVEKTDYGGTLDWSFDIQYYVLTSFYWSYTVAQLFGGIAVQYFGTKIIFGYAILASSFCNICIPLLSSIHFLPVILLQILHGAAQGLTWPAVFGVIGHWIPVQERSRFITCLQGLNLGSAIGQVSSGFIIAAAGWIYVFYTIGTLGFLWCLVWYLLAYDKPEFHPRITLNELHYIKSNRESNLHDRKKIPWKSIVCSLPVWAVAIASFGRTWLTSTIQIYGPLYLKSVVGLSVEMNGLWSAASSMCSFVSSLLSSWLSDKFMVKKTLPLISNRRLIAGVGHITAAILILTLNYLYCNQTLILTTWITVQVMTSWAFTGVMSNIVDISPNYSGPVSSLIQTISLAPNVLATLVVKSLLKAEDSFQAWNGIFGTVSGVLISTYVFFAVFASSNVQLWDYSNNSNEFRHNSKEYQDVGVSEDD